MIMKKKNITVAYSVYWLRYNRFDTDNINTCITVLGLFFYSYYRTVMKRTNATTVLTSIVVMLHILYNV